MEDGSTGVPSFRKDIKIHDVHDGTKLHQGLTEPEAVEAQHKRQSIPHQLTGFKVYLKKHERMSIFFSSVE